MGLRFQLTTYSPVSAAGIRAGAAAARAAAADDPRAELRDALRAAYAADDAVLCGSGTQALQLAIATAVADGGAGVPRLVALPAFCCYDVAAAAVGARVGVLLYDVDPATLAPDLDSLRRTLAQGARAVVACPLYGVPLDWDAVEGVAAEFGAVVVEDAAQGHGGSLRGRPLGALGRVSVLSFGRGKGWSGARGGAVLVRRGMAAPAAAELAAAGGERGVVAAALAQWTLGRPNVYRLPRSLPFLGLGETRYHAPVPPAAMTRAAAAMVLHSRAEAQREGEARRAHARFYLERLRPGGGTQAVRAPSGGEPGYLRLPVRLARGMSAFARPPLALGVGTTYPTTLETLPQLRPALRGAPARYPGAEELVRTLVTLPTHSRLSRRERERVIAAVHRAVTPAAVVPHVVVRGVTVESAIATQQHD